MTALSAVKDPDDRDDFELSWATRLGEDTISTSMWVVPDGITKESDSSTATTTTVRLSGGTAGEEYNITNRVVTASDRQLDQSLRVYVRSQ